MSSSVYLFTGSCPSLVTMRWNNWWASAFSLVATWILGRRCCSKYDYLSSITSLPKSNKDGIWIPWALMDTLGLLATACCIISNLFVVKMAMLWIDQINKFMRTTLISSCSLVLSWRRLQFSFFGGLLAPPLDVSWLFQASHWVNFDAVLL